MRSSALSLSGVFPPIPTPFDAEGNVHYRALVENLERWNQYDLAVNRNGDAGNLTELVVRVAGGLADRHHLFQHPGVALAP